MVSKKAKAFLLIMLLLLALASIIMSVLIGSVRLNVLDIFSIIAERIFGTPAPHISDIQKEIIWNIRLPRVLLAFLAGGALALGGAVVQSVLKNPLASPYTMGVSAGASLAISIIIAFGISVPALGIFFRPLVGFLAGILAVVSVIMLTLAVDKRTTGMTIVLTGMVLSLFYSAIQTLISAVNQDSIREITVWQMGSFAMRGWIFVYMMIPFFVIGVISLMFFNRELDVMTLGDEQARSIGVNTSFVMPMALSLSALLVGASVAVSGIIGFVDLVTPHVARRLFGSRHIYIMPASVIIGGTMMVLADLAARAIIAPAELPVGAVTAVIGVPFFCYIFFRGRGKSV